MRRGISEGWREWLSLWIPIGALLLLQLPGCEEKAFGSILNDGGGVETELGPEFRSTLESDGETDGAAQVVGPLCRTEKRYQRKAFPRGS